MSNHKFEGKVALITGGSSGIGKAVSTAFAENAAKVVIADINEKDGKALAKKLSEKGKDALFLKTDVSDPGAVENMV